MSRPVASNAGSDAVTSGGPTAGGAESSPPVQPREFNLAAEEEPGGPAVESLAVSPISPVLEHEREQMRGVIALILLTMLAGVVVGALLTMWTGWAQMADLSTLLQIIFSPLIGLAGAVTGFYYGSAAAAQASSGTAARGGTTEQGRNGR